MKKKMADCQNNSIDINNEKIAKYVLDKHI